MMLLAQETNRYYFPLIFLSVFLSLIQMFTMEYFLGLELLRPIILGIFYYNRGSYSNKLKLVRKTFYSSWFYIFFLGVYVIWRVFYLNLAGDDPNDPVFLRELIQSPVKSFFNLIQVVLQDILHFLLSWFTNIDPINIDIRRPFFIASTGVAIVTAFLLWLALSQYKPPVQSNNGGKWYRQAIVFGIVATLSGTLPVWLIGRQASLGLYGNRFGLAAMFGLSIMLVGLLEWLSDRVTEKNVVICIMIGLAIHTHLYTAKEFQNSWEKQRRVYWQLYWRAPYIEPGTAIIAPGEVFNYVGIYSTSMGITLLYPPTENPQNMPYWFFSMGRGLYRNTEELVAGTSLTYSFRNYSFKGNSQNALIFYLPGENQCMRILTGNDEIDRDVPKILKPVISISNPERITNNPDRDWKPPESIFGKEPEHTWCYFFEKAELARQSQDWEQVLTIMHDAEQRSYSPANVKEYLPLLEAYLYTNQIEEAQILTRHIKKLSDRVDDLTCNTWLIALEANPSVAIDAAYQSVEDELSCFD
jgi:hypothetical protein